MGAPRKNLAHARNFYLEIVFLATFTMLALAVANLWREERGPAQIGRKAVFGRVYFAVRAVVVRLVKVKRAVLFQRGLYSRDVFVAEEPLKEEPAKEPVKEPVKEVAKEKKEEEQVITQEEIEAQEEFAGDVYGSNISITTMEMEDGDVVIDETDEVVLEDLDDDEEEEVEPTPAPTPKQTAAPTPKQTPAPTATPTATPAPTVMEMAGPFDLERVQERVAKMSAKLEKRSEEVRRSMRALNENLNEVIICQETDVDMYLRQMGSTTNRGSLKFDAYLEGISIPKSHSNMWATPMTPPKTEFAFEVRDKSREQSINKISFGVVPVEKCVLKSFYLKIGYKKEPPVFTKTFAHKRQNFSMPFPMLFDTMTIVALENNGNSTTMCLPEFRVYQHTGLLFNYRHV